MNKPTKSRDGESRVSLRVEHRLALGELAHVFWAAATNGGYGPVEHEGFPRNPIAIVRSAVTRYLEERGVSTHVYDDETFTGSAEAQRWAFEHVARAYGFDESEIPEPEVDPTAARRVARLADGYYGDLDEGEV